MRFPWGVREHEFKVLPKAWPIYVLASQLHDLLKICLDDAKVELGGCVRLLVWNSDLTRTRAYVRSINITRWLALRQRCGA